MLLKPVIVTLHLLGGMATLAMLSWLALRQMTLPRATGSALRLRPWAAAGLLIVICQIALGGWVSANYAALVCRDFPTCHGAWFPAMDFGHGFQFARELGMTAAGTPLALDALTAIHWAHRVGALVTFLYIGALAVALMRAPGCLRLGGTLAVLLAVQVGLGHRQRDADLAVAGCGRAQRRRGGFVGHDGSDKLRPFPHRQSA